MKHSFLANPYLVLVSRCILGFVFVFAAIDKIVAPDAFAESVYAYGLVPYPMINLFALIIPWIELICGIFLVAGVCLRSSSLLISILLLFFIVAIIIALGQNLNIDCGCFGKDHATPISWMKVLEDVFLLLLGLHIAFFDAGFLKIEDTRSPANEG
ncbi:MAG TPA: MauE/DoxX family redox-associated membrane protein [Bacteroidota bacterium]|nr:MauE/DoxX family redox-associated membrane protein [Bacteroidota bacterium]